MLVREETTFTYALELFAGTHARRCEEMTPGLGALAECIKVVPHRAQRVSRPGLSRRKNCSEIPGAHSLFFLCGQSCRWTFLLTDYASDQKLDGFGTLCSRRSLRERLQAYESSTNLWKTKKDADPEQKISGSSSNRLSSCVDHPT